MKKIIFTLFSFAIVLSSFSFFGYNATMAEQFENEYICVANFCYLYQAPSFTAEKVKDENKSPIIVKHKDILVLNYLENNLIEENDSQGKTFYSVKSVNSQAVENAYIFSDFVTLKQEQIDVYPAFNASTNSDTYLYLANGEEILETETLIKKNSRIYLYEGYNSSLEFNKVAVRVDNSLEYGYIKTEAISPDGINPAIIYAITIALACIGIITALLFMKKSHKKLKS